jgi:hypothetical protein
MDVAELQRFKDLEVQHNELKKIIADLLLGNNAIKAVLAQKHHINLQYIEPGKPTQNAYLERNNGCMGREVLDAYLFTSLPQARQILSN